MHTQTETDTTAPKTQKENCSEIIGKEMKTVISSKEVKNDTIEVTGTINQTKKVGKNVIQMTPMIQTSQA